MMHPRRKKKTPYYAPIITIFENGKRGDGKVILFPLSISHLLDSAGRKLGLVEGAAAAYKDDGTLITDIDMILPRDVIYIASTYHPAFVPPKANDKEGKVIVPPNSEWVSLNVGGRIFSTTKSTLTKDPYSRLAKMVLTDTVGRSGSISGAIAAHISSEEGEPSFLARSFSSSSISSLASSTSSCMSSSSSTKPLYWLRDANGCYLLDRSPEYFAPILNYLRCGTLVMDDGLSEEGVLEEARFFEVAGVEEVLLRQISTRMHPDSFTRRDILSLLLTSSTISSLRSQGINLEGVDLSKLDLSHINFKMSNFIEADLSHCNLDSAMLQQANLKGANLTGASLRGANLGGANLEGANLHGANFEDRGMTLVANLSGANLMNANLEDANLAGANLRAANLKGANLENANLRGTNLAGANLEDTNLKGAILNMTNMRGANLQGIDYDLRTVTSR
eukprot:TRINITY_DN7480_c0_g1_i1.p1 TRINITY_DN7480_c0_g1~~TRINITY_DN7480_c0_g1_i1.p1  ORF type:complete len:450 (+),score=71.10 TRINITY_DN7480_c0_g1_i1:67-1416(+)